MTYYDLIKQYEDRHDLEIEAIKFIISESLGVASLVSVLYDEVKDDIYAKVMRYVNGEAAQYIVGHTYFYGEKFYVSKDVLIPRFDSEVVVDEALKILKKKENPSVCDAFTGSGALAIAIKKNCTCQMDAFDISKEALAMARKNAHSLGADINFFESDVFSNVSKKYDCLIANPPYIKYGDEEVEKRVKDNEPSLALYAKEEGLYFYRIIMDEVKKILKNQFVIICEIPYNNTKELNSMAKERGLNPRFIKDLAGNDRVMIIEGNYA